MIGWVHRRNETDIHPVLCYYSMRYMNGITHTWMVTATGRRWPMEEVVPLDTEAEVTALLLQGFTMISILDFKGSTYHIVKRLQGRVYR